MKQTNTERAYWNRAAKNNKMIYDEWLTEKTYNVVNNFVAKQGRKILEVGSGDGRLINRLAKDYPDREFTGIDISSEMLHKAQNKQQSNTTFFLCDGRSLGTDKTYSAAYCVTVFQHLPKDGIKAYLKEVYRSLERGGHFLFQFIEGQEQEPFSRHYPLQDMLGMLTKAKYKIEHISYGVHEQWTWIGVVK